MKFGRACMSVAMLVVAAAAVPNVSLGALAQLTDWTGHLNTEAANDYRVISPTSVGGTFQSRKSPPPSDGTFPENWYLRDSTLAGGPLGYDDFLAMSGTISLNNPSNADPSWFFGWYSSSDYRFRLGLSAAQAVVFPAPPVPPNAIRMQIARGNGGALTTLPLTSDGGSSSLKAVIPAGTYEFSFNYAPGASDNLTAHIRSSSTDWRRENLTVNASTPGVFDRFGFLQVGATSNPDPAKSTATFDVIVSDLRYTGQTPVPEPSMILLSVAGFGIVAVRTLCLQRKHP